MAHKLDHKELVTFDDLTLANLWELEALVEVLAQKGLMTKREVLDMLTELRRRNPRVQAKDVLTHLQVLVEIGERMAHGKTMH
jgi:hypothetical protein